MSNLNIFSSIKKATRQIEPLCTQFLADALEVSIRGNRSLFEQTWTLCAPSAWEPPREARIVAEELLEENRRIDIAILDEKSNRVLGIEAKTSEGSVDPGQLERYFRFLQSMNPGYDVAIAFLTPFNQELAKDFLKDSSEALRLPSIKEFEELCRYIPRERTVHANWRDIARIEWREQSCWSQFQSFLLTEISAESDLVNYLRQDHALERFFSDQAKFQFWGAMPDWCRNDGIVELEKLARQPSDLREFLHALTFLIEDDGNVNRRAIKNDRFPDNRKSSLVGSDFGLVHREIFDLSRKYDHVWIQGERDYGLRVAHRNHRAAGVSLLRSYIEREQLQINCN